jgi:protein gp37
LIAVVCTKHLAVEMNMTTTWDMPRIITSQYKQYVQYATKKEPIEMLKKTNISWCDYSWNVAVGCTKVDSDCTMCYMYRDSMARTRYNPNQVRRTKTVFDKPLRIKEPSRIFTSSLTDFFHQDIDPYRWEAFDIIRRCPQHTFQILTKRPERVMECLKQAIVNAIDAHTDTPISKKKIDDFMALQDWLNLWIMGTPPPNVWLGTSCGSQKAANIRIPELLKIPAYIRFLSLEPLHGPINFYDGELRGHTWHIAYNHDGKEAELSMDIDWVIIGGESGNDTGNYRYRPCEIEWIQYLVEELVWEEIPVFVKQLGTCLSKQYGLKDRHGGDMDEWPESLNYLKKREFPVNQNNIPV